MNVKELTVLEVMDYVAATISTGSPQGIAWQSRVSEARNSVADLLDALVPFARVTITPDGKIIGLMREDFEKARAAIEKANEVQP